MIHTIFQPRVLSFHSLWSPCHSSSSTLLKSKFAGSVCVRRCWRWPCTHRVRPRTGGCVHCSISPPSSSSIGGWKEWPRQTQRQPRGWCIMSIQHIFISLDNEVRSLMSTEHQYPLTWPLKLPGLHRFIIVYCKIHYTYTMHLSFLFQCCPWGKGAHPSFSTSCGLSISLWACPSPFETDVPH